jgi:hypothetical protein
VSHLLSSPSFSALYSLPPLFSLLLSSTLDIGMAPPAPEPQSRPAMSRSSLRATNALKTLSLFILLLLCVLYLLSTESSPEDAVPAVILAAAPIAASLPPLPLFKQPKFPHLYFVTTLVSPDAIGYSGTPRHDATFCSAKRMNEAPGVFNIHPVPLFGEQCTLHQTDAIAACVQLAGCQSITTPDPGPYSGVREDLGTRGPISQLRSASVGAWLAGTNLEPSHGMCAPSGCESLFLTRISRTDLSDVVLSQIDHFKPFLLRAHTSLLAVPSYLATKAWKKKWGVNSYSIGTLIYRGAIDASAFPWLLKSNATKLARELGYEQRLPAWTSYTTNLTLLTIPHSPTRP